MKLYVILALLLVLAVTILALARSTGDRGAEPAVSIEEVAPASDAEPASDADPTLETLLDESAESERREVSSSPDLDLEGAQWVGGRVLFPAECEVDPDLEVLALSEPLEYRRLVRRMAGEHSRILARVPVDADGSFRLPFPQDVTVGWVGLRGRYLYLRQAVPVVPTRSGAHLELAPRAGARVVGRVERAAGVEASALAAADVRLRSEIASGDPRAGDRARLRLTLTPEASGAFHIPAVPVESDYLLAIEHPRLAGTRARVHSLSPGRDHPVELSLSIGARVSGRVVDEAGAGVAEAAVTAYRQGSFMGLDDEELREGSSDSSGLFHLEGLPAGNARLDAKKSGMLVSDKLTVELVEGEEVGGLELLLTTGGVIAGRVLFEDGQPGAGAQLRVEFDTAMDNPLEMLGALRGGDGSGVADSEGRFEVTGLGRGPFVVAAEVEREGALQRGRRAGIRPGAEDLEVVLSPPIGLAGRVEDQNGEPVTAFRIAIRRHVEGMFGGVTQETRHESFEVEEGAFLLQGCDAGEWDLWVEGETNVSLEVTRISLPRAGSEPLVLVAPAVATVIGRVVTPDGAAVPGAQVRHNKTGGGLVPQLEAGPQSPETTSDAKGAFRLERVPPLPATLIASAEDWALSEPLPIEPAPGEELLEVLLVVTTGGTITGEVYDDDGERAPGRLVTATALDSMGSGEITTRIARSDERGEFRLEHLTPGNWQLVAIDMGGELVGDDGAADLGALVSSLDMATAVVVEGESVHVVIGAPPADPVRVFGRVTLGDEPFLGANVVFIREGENPLGTMQMTTVDDDGRYEVVLDGPGGYITNVQSIAGAPGQQTTVEYQSEIPEVREHRLDFALPLGRISGRVLDPAGEPLAGARVTLTLDSDASSVQMFGGRYSEVAADGEGRFDLIALSPGTYRVSAGGTLPFGFGGGGLGRVTRGDIRLAEDQWIDDLELVVPKAGSLGLRVRGSDGAPAGGATIFVRDASGRPLEPFSMLATDPSGQCTYDGLAPGDYSVLARTVEESSQEIGPIRVREGEATAVELDLEPGTILWILLQRRGGGEPLTGRVRVVDEAGHEMASLLGFQDLAHLYSGAGFSTTEHRLGPLPPGRYVVHAESGELRASKPVRIKGGGSRRLVLRLR